jgi:hypothetical protein
VQVWKRANDAGHLTDALAAELTPIGKALPDKAEPEPTGMLVISPDVQVTDEQGNEL